MHVVVAQPAAVGQETETDLRAEIDALKEGQERIRRELEEIRRILEGLQRAAPAGPDVGGKIFDLGDNPVRGEATARLTLVEFTDYQCPYCSRYVRDAYPQIESAYIATGRLRYATLDLPLERLHPLAWQAAEATHCAADQGRFWEMHERLFAHQRSLEPFAGHAEAIGLDVARFEACLQGDQHIAGIRRDIAQAANAGATGTPSFVLALTDPADAGKVTGLAFIRGAQPFATFQQQIEDALASLEAD
jgi:protein-disulfide isomerase